jgi:hypothetical protein
LSTFEEGVSSSKKIDNFDRFGLERENMEEGKDKVGGKDK